MEELESVRKAAAAANARAAEAEKLQKEADNRAALLEEVVKRTEAAVKAERMRNSAGLSTVISVLMFY